MDAYELELHRRNTDLFIAADGLSLVLMRSERTQSASGGTSVAPPEPVAEQRFRLIPIADGQADEVKTSSGSLARPAYVILGSWDADLERWDSFTHQGVEWEVVSPVGPEHSDESVYERKATVARRG